MFTNWKSSKYQSQGWQKVNKAALRNQVASKAGLSKKSVRNVRNASTKTVCDAFSSGERVTLAGFGTFQVAQRQARRGVNPQTRETIQIPAKKVAKFVSGKGIEGSSRVKNIDRFYRESIFTL